MFRLLGVNSAAFADEYAESKTSVLDAVAALKQRMDNVGPLLEGGVDFGDLPSEMGKLRSDVTKNTVDISTNANKLVAVDAVINSVFPRLGFVKNADTGAWIVDSEFSSTFDQGSNKQNFADVMVELHNSLGSLYTLVGDGSNWSNNLSLKSITALLGVNNVQFEGTFAGKTVLESLVFLKNEHDTTRATANDAQARVATVEQRLATGGDIETRIATNETGVAKNAADIFNHEGRL